MNKKILIVDDSGDNRYLLKSLLEEEGFAVVEAENGREALEKAEADPPDLIVSDILMPVMDGYLLCRKCKADERLRQIPFVFYTATYTEPKDEKFALSLGADRFVLKPQEPESLIGILHEVLRERSTAGEREPKPLGEEMEFFRQYNDILFKKLEKKMLDLETANRKLKCLEEQYRLSFENVTDIVWTIGADLRIMKMSPSVERMLGYKPAELIGRSIAELAKIFAPDSTERAMNEIGSVLKGETIPASVYPLVTKGGTITYGEISGSPILRDGKIVGMVSVIRDITKRKRAEDELHSMNLFLDSIVENIPNMIILKNAADLRYVRFNRAGEEMQGHSRDEMLGKNAYDLFPKDVADQFTMQDRQVLHSKTLLDIPAEPLLTHHRGNRVLHTKKVPILDKNGQPQYLLGISEDITESKRSEDALVSATERLKRALDFTVRAISTAVEVRDPYTAGHQRRVAELAKAIAVEMGLSADRIDFVSMAANIHDIGKIAVPAEILSSPRQLTAIEFSLIKLHPGKGYDILKDIEFPWPVAAVILQHHERLDGSGYPQGLKEEAILIEARIIAVADVVESMASHRPYRPSRGIEPALDEIAKNKGALYDPAVVEACERLFKEESYKLVWDEPE
ncbi:MAG: response regulator [Syntrophales bacterium]